MLNKFIRISFTSLLKLIFIKVKNKGLFLIFSAILSIIFTNSKYAFLYYHLIESSFQFYITDSNIVFISIKDCMNSIFMTIFFFYIIVHLKEKIITSNLKNKIEISMIVIMAILGAIFPVFIYIIFNYHDIICLKAWGIPAATDIALAIGIIRICKNALPLKMNFFLIMFAIIDDFIAIIMIAVFYNNRLHIEYFILIISSVMFLCWLINKRVILLSWYFMLGIFMWYCFLKLGIHPTIAGSILALLIPLQISQNNTSFINNNKLLTPYIDYIILPLFIFFNNGICLASINLFFLYHSIVTGIILGLFLGKIIGILLSILILKFWKIIILPKILKIKHYYYLSVVCGIGFTMSVFVALLVFEKYSLYLELAKGGIVIGSLFSAIITILSIKIFK